MSARGTERNLISDPMTSFDNSDFWRWLCKELADEAHQGRSSAGRLPPKPVCLSEVEAVGLMVLAFAAQQQERPGGLAAHAARWLVDTLRGHLDRLSPDLSTGRAR